MSQAPRVYLKNGKKYFKVNGKRIFIRSKMSEREIMDIYKLLKKTMQGKKTKITNTARAVVNIHNPPAPRRRRRRVTKKPFVSTIDEKNRVSVSGADRHPKDSGKMTK